MINKIFCILMLLFVSNLSAQTVSKDINEEIDKIRAEFEIPAMAVAVVKKDEIFYGVSGVLRIEEKARVNLNSKFHLGSCTKAITAFIAAKMVEEGKLSYEDKLLDVVPKLKGKIKKDYENITLKQLLSHRALLQPFTDSWNYIPDFQGDVRTKRLKFAEYALSLKPIELKDETFFYSNAGYTLAALMLEAKTGKSWEDLVKVHFKKLGLDFYIGFPNKQNLQETWGHERNADGKLLSLSPDYFSIPDFFAPTGDLSMNIIDYSKFIQMNLRGLLGEDNYLKSESYKRNHFGMKDYAFGWFNGELGENEKFTDHAGSADTYYCYVINLPTRNLSIVIMLNSADENDRQASDKLRNLLIKKYGTKSEIKN